jgi:hypothetical protein
LSFTPTRLSCCMPCCRATVAGCLNGCWLSA